MGMDMVVMTGPQLSYFRVSELLHVHARVYVIHDTSTLVKGMYVSLNQAWMWMCQIWQKMYLSFLQSSELPF